MIKFFKSIGFVLSFPWVGIAMLFGALIAKRKARRYLKDPANYSLEQRLKTVYKLFSKFLYLKRIEIHAENIDALPTKQMLYIANHKDNTDPMVIFKVLYEAGKLGGISFVCKYELSKAWVTRVVIQLMDGIFIKRDDGRSIYACYLKETENIKKGMSIMVFPEGTRVVGDEFKEFKPTVLKVAYENFISICPLVLYGTDKKRKLFNKKIVRITSLKPIQPSNFITTKKEPMMASLQNKIIDKYNELKKSIEEKSK